MREIFSNFWRDNSIERFSAISVGIIFVRDFPQFWRDNFCERFSAIFGGIIFVRDFQQFLGGLFLWEIFRNFWRNNFSERFSANFGWIIFFEGFAATFGGLIFLKVKINYFKWIQFSGERSEPMRHRASFFQEKLLVRNDFWWNVKES